MCLNTFVTPLIPADVPACMTIYNYYVRTTTFSLEEEELSFSVYEARVQSVLAGNYPFLVARGQGGQVFGFAYLSMFNPRSGYRRTADLSIYVDAQVRKAGVGTQLLAAVEEAGRARGITTLISLITGENAASLAFHERNGFACVGRLTHVAVKFGRELDVVYCQKSL